MFFLEGEEAAYHFLADVLDTFHAYGEVYVSQRLGDKQIRTTKATVGISVSDGLLSLDLDTGEFPPEELEDLYPDLTPKERENAFTRAHGTVCIMQIGGQLKSGIRHDGRAPDYDDWTLNCDILFWHKALGCALELSSMGIRVDPAAMTRQLEAAGFAGAAFMDKDEVKVFAAQ